MSFLVACLLLSVGLISTQVNLAPKPDVGQTLQDILDMAFKAPLYTYPTSLTQGILPVSSTIF
jgi:hypothetical protein